MLSLMLFISNPDKTRGIRKEHSCSTTSHVQIEKLHFKHLKIIYEPELIISSLAVP